MNVWLPYIAAILACYIVFVGLIALLDFVLKRRHQPADETALVSLESGATPITPVRLYPATYWTLFMKWQLLFGAFTPLLIGIGSFYFMVVWRGGEPLVQTLWSTGKLVGGTCLLLGVPILLVHHLFGGRLAGALFAFAEYGIAKEGLLYRPFYRWHLIPWPQLIRIDSKAYYLAKRPGLRIFIVQGGIFPRWYRYYLWGGKTIYPILLMCQLPNSRQLVRDICWFKYGPATAHDPWPELPFGWTAFTDDKENLFDTQSTKNLE